MKHVGWEEIGDSIEYLNGYEAILTIVDEIKKGFNMVRLVTDKGILELPEEHLRKVDQVLEIRGGGLTFQPKKAFLCKLVISETAKMTFFREVIFSKGLELKLKKSGKKLRLNSIYILSDFIGQAYLDMLNRKEAENEE